MFEICVIYEAKSPKDRELFISELSKKGIVKQIREEKGCIAYEYFLSIDDERNVVLLEKWESREHQKVHMTQPHMKDAMEIKNKYIEKTSLKELSDLIK